MSRVVNAVVVGIAAFVLLAGLAWILFVASTGEGGGRTRERPTPTTEETTFTSTSTSDGSTITRTVTSTVTNHPTTSATAPQTTAAKPTKTSNSTGNATPGVAVIQQEGVRVDPFWVEDVALRFILGGLILMSVVFVVLLLQGLVPRRKGEGAPLDQPTRFALQTPTLPDLSATQPIRFLAEEIETGRRLTKRQSLKSLDDVLEAYDEAYGGKPRVMRLLEDRVVVRLYKCNECGGSGEAGCRRAAGFFASALERVYDSKMEVVETRCRAQEGPVCEFEVRG